ncbi:MAG TPA: vitamin K epoxide reductase family protein [Rugosimonospora sp.]|nr:vitamin K epoxide reductase family protein [Rugosimonospora sp.]
MLIAVAGLAVAAYLTIEHYTASTTLACPETGVVNCQKVTTSAQSVVFGIPVALLGLVFFAAMLPLGLPVAWRAAHPLPRWGRAGFALVGVGFVFYLVYTELFTLNAICLWCTAVHVLTLALFAVVAIGTAVSVPD